MFIDSIFSLDRLKDILPVTFSHVFIVFSKTKYQADVCVELNGL